MREVKLGEVVLAERLGQREGEGVTGTNGGGSTSPDEAGDELMGGLLLSTPALP